MEKNCCEWTSGRGRLSSSHTGKVTDCNVTAHSGFLEFLEFCLIMDHFISLWDNWNLGRKGERGLSNCERSGMKLKTWCEHLALPHCCWECFGVHSSLPFSTGRRGQWGEAYRRPIGREWMNSFLSPISLPKTIGFKKHHVLLITHL